MVNYCFPSGDDDHNNYDVADVDGFQWAKVIMSIERTVPPNTAKEFLEKYSIKLSATERGVMVIKKKDKTRASQRKGALSNWKVIIIMLYATSQLKTFNGQFFAGQTFSCHRILLPNYNFFKTRIIIFQENGKNDNQVFEKEKNDWR